MRMRFFRLTSFALLLLIGGCSTTAPPVRSQLARSYYDNISMAGRLSVQYQQNGKPQSMQGKFSWTQSAEMTSIALLSPLGQTMAQIEIAPGKASLQQAGEPLRQATDIGELTTQALGWPMPVAGLRNWLQGFALEDNGNKRPAMPDTQSGFSSDGWQVHYVSWQGAADTPAYPKRIDLERATPDAGVIGLRIVIDSWQPK
jgi:outer membrane lipoprotein LolB